MAEFRITSPIQGKTIKTTNLTVKGVAKSSIVGTSQKTETTYKNIKVSFNDVFYTSSLNYDPDIGSWDLSVTLKDVSPNLNIKAQAIRVQTKYDKEGNVIGTPSESPVSDTVTVLFDPLSPKIYIISPVTENPTVIAVHETGHDLEMVIRAEDNLRVVAVDVSIDNNVSYRSLVQNAIDSRIWNSNPSDPINIPGVPWQPGIRKLFVRAFDEVSNSTVASLDFITPDIDAPVKEILSPKQGKKIPWSGTQTIIEVNGTATDWQSGVASVTCKLLDKADKQVGSDGVQQFPAAPGAVGFKIIFSVAEPGWYHIQCEFRDHVGNLSTETISNLEVAESFSPADVNDLVGLRQYLDDLLKFSRNHFKKYPNSSDVTADDLKAIFYQEFERLAKHTDASTAQWPVNQVRLCIEILRRFLNSINANAALNIEREYASTAYELLLHHFGTSYEELRLTRGASENQRLALAQRLGINLNPQWSTYLNNLLLDPQQLTEPNLETWFGLVDTSQDPFTLKPAGQLLEWQSLQLKTNWVLQDRELIDPIIDPDVIGQADLMETDSTNEVFKLWNQRHEEINTEYAELKSFREQQPTALEGLQKIADKILAPIINSIDASIRLNTCSDSEGNPLPVLQFIACLDDQQKAGKNIKPILGAMHLDISALRYLTRILNLARAPSGLVTEAEWEDVYQILTRVWKDDQRKVWRDNEVNISISPQFFRLYDGALPNLPHTGILDGALLSAGVEDPNWILVKAPAGIVTDKVYVTVKQPGVWLPNDDQSHWICPAKDGNEGLPTGDYRYRTHFDLSGWDLTTVQIIAKIAVDDSLLDVILNGVSLKLVASGFLKFTTLALNGPVKAGENVIEFIVNNGSVGNNPSGLRAELLFATQPRRLQSSQWRVKENARSYWQQLLRTRIEQQESLYFAFNSAIRATEEATLPILRDALIQVIGQEKGMVPNYAADWLSERLLIETKGGGWRLTTRVLQAIETIQSLALSLRTQRFQEDHPAHDWSLPFGSTGYDTQDQFDEEWQWAGSYDSWRAAMLVFYYPENILLPSLREMDNQTVQFKDFLTDLRAKSRLTPTKARDCAKQYLKARSEKNLPIPGNFIITEERNDDSLKELRGIAEEVLPNFSQASPEYLKEIFYYIPMALGLQLQKSGEYTAALDWFQTVYAYNLPIDQRKIYPGLRVEINGTPSLSRIDHWLREGLNPHTLAANRAYPMQPDSGRTNPYTRYTLMSLARCFLEFADSEFTQDTGESLARARSLYLSARELLSLPDFDQIQPQNEQEVLLPNPVLKALRDRIENQLAKIRLGRNIAGMKREIEIPTPPKTFVGLPTVGSGGQLVIPGMRRPLKPTPYRFAVLMERAKQLVNIAQQIEAAYLSALEKRDGENYNLKKAGFDLQLAEAGSKLQALRETEALDGEELVVKQKSRATKQKSTYKQWIDDGLSTTENILIASYTAGGAAKALSAGTTYGLEAAKAAQQALVASSAAIPMSLSQVSAATAAGAAVAAIAAVANFKLGFDEAAIVADTTASISSFVANHERRANDWQLAYDLADIEEQIADQQDKIAKDHTAIVKKEKEIAETQTTQARAISEYLANKFTSAELYEWMSGILGNVYSYFLQQATAVAMLAENQLTFERQEAPSSFIQSDYWEAPSEDGTTTSNEQTKDRRGLTGSARLLQDIYQLDQYAFETNKRKLNLAHTVSLASLDPYAFAVFRTTGVLNFNTPMRLFDETFPGHYLRLIKRVRTSVVALIPPILGIRATLTASGISRVVIGGDIFQETTIRRDPELVALSSPINATGVFELDAQSELLMPFESMGVDTRWEFMMPKASNPFNFDTIADVMVTIEYTALFNDDYRRQVIQQLNPYLSADKAYSIRDDFPDIWYDLNNSSENVSGEIRFRTERSYFPPNLESEITVKEILFMVLPKDIKLDINGEVSLSYTPDVASGKVTQGLKAMLTDRRIHTRLPSGNSAWGDIRGKSVIGDWQFILPPELISQLREGIIDNILVVVTFSGMKPKWPF